MQLYNLHFCQNEFVNNNEEFVECNLTLKLPKLENSNLNHWYNGIIHDSYQGRKLGVWSWGCQHGTNPTSTMRYYMIHHSTSGTTNHQALCLGKSRGIIRVPCTPCTPQVYATDSYFD